MSWTGIKVKHVDGREGVIWEYSGFLCLLLTIRHKEGKQIGCVQLNANGPDSGDKGWSWYCENLSGGARWLTLGDHNPDAESDI